MAQVMSSNNVLIAFFIAAVFGVATVSAQLAPAPSPDAGAAFSIPISGALVGTSMILSLVALLRH